MRALVKTALSMPFDFDTMYCGAIKRGDIFIAQIEGVDTLVVVLQDTLLNERLSSVLVVPVEPYVNKNKVFKNEVVLKTKDTGLGEEGVCRLYEMTRLGREHLLAKKGEVSRGLLQALYEALDINLGRFRD